ncbi:response regulator receiver modulated metal dependent phosphohydrolase [Methylobacterium sp. 4-46]|uniref:HD-GYP domain-containing protein n=1 Tax=unclassified Methylobacterium TaxID=2615210 RepID=UPI000152D267|nr:MULTISPECIES: HD domain-containing phosphohydrolase [Methylobacterium]ACA19361.1 response regulator receiver modulated metal dependent phosphohydrolase [Methylobacterium sp. 4-46]WFT78560.1 HD domain-containing phosphohydrolase [Methylobacterium nodulans]
MTSAADPSVVIVTARPDPAQLSRLFAPAYATLVLGEAEAARSALADQGTDLVLIEDGPRLDAIGLVRDLRRLPHLVRTSLMVLGSGEPGAARRRALEAGATDVVLPPLDGFDLQIRARNLVALSRAQAGAAEAEDLAREMRRVHAQSAQREREIIHRLMLAAEYRDDQAGGHLTRVAGCVIAIADGLGLPEEEANDIALASTMHDIGKIGVADAILRKPGPLSEAERVEMMEHALRGYRMLSDSPSRLLRLAAEIALTHHERWDGTGYPRGLKGEAIPLPGRITAVADVFDALISDRVYKPGWPLDRARSFLEEEAGRHFDPACVRAFLSRWDEVVALVEDRPATRAA